MQLGIFAKTFQRPTVEEVFAAVQAHGLGLAQFNLSCAGLPSMPDKIPPEVVARVRAAARAQGVEIAAVSGTYNMIHPDVALREQGLRRLGELAAACQGLGTGVISLCTGTRDPENMWRWHPRTGEADAWADLLAVMERALRIAEDYQVTLAVEPEYANVVNSARRGRELLDALRSPRLKIILDVANLIDPLRGTASDHRRVMEEAVDLLGPEIIMLHAKDRAADGGFRAAGRGILDFGYLLKLARAAAFDGPVILHGLSEDEVSASVEEVRGRLKPRQG